MFEKGVSVFWLHAVDLLGFGFFPPVVYDPVSGRAVAMHTDVKNSDAAQGALGVARFVIEVADRLDALGKTAVVVHKTASEKEQRRSAKGLKPWTREDLPTVLLMNLAESRQYGHRVDRGGSHASPHPHTRRGHYASLVDPKFRRNEDGTVRRVWVRPAWVGDSEWVFEGRQYKVIGATP
jgi:hypothetical protein